MAMNNKMKSLFVLSLSALALSACGTIRTKGGVHPVTAAEMFPITVDQQTVTLTLSADPTLTALTNRDKARLSAFLDAYASNGHGPITITAPSGNSADYFGQEMAADVRNALHDMGVPWDNMLGATYRVSGASTDQELIVSYTRYVASATACEGFGETWQRNRQNLPSKNFGCATQNNLAAMIIDPRDLVEPTALSPADTVRQVKAISDYQEGNSTASAEESSSSVSTTD